MPGFRFSAGLAIAVALAAQGSPDAAWGCTSGVSTLAGLPPGLNGLLAFEATDSSGNPHLFGYDFLKPGRFSIDSGWQLHSALNPDISRDANWVAFTGAPNACTDGNGGYYPLIYIYKFGSTAAPIPLFACDHSSRWEDVRFSADMGSVVYKHRYGPYPNYTYALETLAVTLNANGTVSKGARTTLVADAKEWSAPSLSPTGKYVYYFEGAGASEMVVYQRAVGATASSAETAMTPDNNVVDAWFPVVRDLSTVFYARHTMSATRDQLYYQLPALAGLGAEYAFAFSDCNWDNSDPAPADEDYLVFSKDSVGGSYGLFIGQLGTKNVWSLATQLQPGAPAATISSLRGASYRARPNSLAP
jgi:hypothetical protein